MGCPKMYEQQREDTVVGFINLNRFIKYVLG